MITAILVWLAAGLAVAAILGWVAWMVGVYSQVFGFLGGFFSMDLVRAGAEGICLVMEAAAKAAGDALNNS